MKTFTIALLLSLSPMLSHAYDENEELYEAYQRGASQQEMREIEERLYEEKYNNQNNYVPAYGDVTPSYDTAPYQRSLDRSSGRY